MGQNLQVERLPLPTAAIHWFPVLNPLPGPAVQDPVSILSDVTCIHTAVAEGGPLLCQAAKEHAPQSNWAPTQAAGPDFWACRHFSQMWHDRISAGTFNGTMFQLTGAPPRSDSRLCQAVPGCAAVGCQHQCIWIGCLFTVALLYCPTLVCAAGMVSMPPSELDLYNSVGPGQQYEACMPLQYAGSWFAEVRRTALHAQRKFQLLPVPVSTIAVACQAKPCPRTGCAATCLQQPSLCLALRVNFDDFT